MNRTSSARSGADRSVGALLARALAEDRVDFDRTTRALFPRPVPARAYLVAERPGVVSGVAASLRLAGPSQLRFRALVRDGAIVRRGTRVVEISGDLRRILAVERTALNLLMHLSGVATAARRAARAAGPGLAVLGTRKTLPGLRSLEKAALVHGGAGPHREDLASAVLVKNAHLAHVPIRAAIERLRRAYGHRERLEVEVRSARTAIAALDAGADALLVDNASPGRAREIVRTVRSRPGGRRVPIELSGGITVDRIPRYREAGADSVSLGALTHSAPALPFHLRFAPGARSRARRRARPARRR